MAMCSQAHVKCAKGNFVNLSLSLSILAFVLCFDKKSCCFFIFYIDALFYFVKNKLEIRGITECFISVCIELYTKGPIYS
jgi:hypothetical protein